MGKSLFMIFITSAIVLVATNLYSSNQHNIKAVDISQQTVLKSDTQNYEDFTSVVIDNSKNEKEYDFYAISGEYEILGDGNKSESVEPTIAPTAVPTITPSATKKPSTTIVPKATPAPMPYYIKINRTQNVVNIYSRDSEGNYTNPYKAMICSIGTSTPKAGSKYRITTYRRAWNGLKGGVFGQYAVQITGNILFHSVPYTAKNNSSLEYWEYDKLGTKASMGCIRLTVQDAKWIYDNIGAGTWVEFYEAEDPGPLGKPFVQKISDNELCRNWDPTDYAEGNPWHEPLTISDDEIIDIEGTEVGENIIIDEYVPIEDVEKYEEYENEINEINELYNENYIISDTEVDEEITDHHEEVEQSEDSTDAVEAIIDRHEKNEQIEDSINIVEAITDLHEENIDNNEVDIVDTQNDITFNEEENEIIIEI